MKSTLPLILFLLPVFGFSKTVIEESDPKVTSMLGTGGYTPTERETSFYKPELDERARTNESLDKIILEGKEEEYIQWFGLVQDVFEDPRYPGKKILMIEGKYFNGYTDIHLQTVSINGPGTYFVIYDPGEYEVIPLMLVRIFGKVESYSKMGAPRVIADYIRVWPWGMFNFHDYGEDNTPEIWRQGLELEGLRIYNTWPDMDYYHARIGGPDENHTRQLRWFAENRLRMKKRVEEIEAEQDASGNPNKPGS